MTPVRRPRLAALTAALLLGGLPGLLSAQPSDERLHVFIDHPDPFTAVFGEVTVEAAVISPEPVERVVFYLDGIVVGEVQEPPFRLRIDVGQENAEHRFEVLAYGAGGATGAASVVTPPIRVDEEVAVELQQLYVTVSAGGRRVLDLAAEDFQVVDDGRRQEIVTFARGDIPFTATVLLDSSHSMEGEKLEAAIRGATAFFGGMKDLDEGRLLVFSDRILHATPVTTFKSVLAAGLHNVHARGGSAVADHLHLALQHIAERQGRRVVVLLSDGVDSHSVLGMEDVLDKARRSQALVYWLRLPYSDRPNEDGKPLPKLRSTWRAPEEYWRDYRLLEEIVASSGGRWIDLTGVASIEPAFREILQELRDQYVLGYYPHAQRHDGSWRRVRVGVRGSRYAVRSQRGYTDY